MNEKRKMNEVKKTIDRLNATDKIIGNLTRVSNDEELINNVIEPESFTPSIKVEDLIVIESSGEEEKRKRAETRVKGKKYLFCGTCDDFTIPKPSQGVDFCSNCGTKLVLTKVK